MLSNPILIHAVTDCSPNSVVIQGTGWLSGGGVNICSTGDDSNNYVNNVNGQSTLSGWKWECVELVNRLYLTKGWATVNWAGNGNTLVNSVPSGLTKQDNGSISYVNAGDVITLNGFTNGHAAVIDTISGSTINIINQNATLNSSAYISSGSLASSNAVFQMNGWSGYSVQAIVHHPTASPYKPSYLASATNNDGTISVFGVWTDNTIRTIRQTAANNPTSWSAWTTLPGGARSIAAAKNQDGRLEIFYGGKLDGKIYYQRQTAANSNSWTTEENLGGNLATPVAAATNSNGTIEVMAVGTDNQLYYNRQTGANADTWTGWIGVIPENTTSVALDAWSDGRLAVFYRGSDGAIWRRHQLTVNTDNWSGEGSLGGNLDGELAAVTDANSKLELFATGTDFKIYPTQQTSPNTDTFTSWGLIAAGAHSLAATKNADGRIQLLYVGGDNSLVYRYELTAGTDNWSGENYISATLMK